MNYKKFIENRLMIVDKTGIEVPFLLNPIQDKFNLEMSGYDVILKSRKQGFSSFILGMYAADFLLRENSRSVVVADIDDNATDLLDRVKRFISSYELITKQKVPLKYNSKTELYNEAMKSRYTIGTSKNTEFGRSKDITNLHLSEAAFYSNMEKLLAGAAQAIVDNGRLVIETTANGFNFFKKFWEECKNGERPFKTHFYKGSDLYSPEFLEKKKAELKDLFPQEYPETDMEAFLMSGDPYFDKLSMQYYYDNVVKPRTSDLLYV